jgi:predicted nucleic acid-binding protein
VTFLYLDTSALLKRYVVEAGSDDVIAAMATADAVVTSLVTRAEVPAAIAKAVRRRVLDDDGGRRAHRRFLHEWPDFWRMAVTDVLVARADTLVWDHGLRAYDAIQLATALTCKETIAVLGTDALFATFDRQLRDAAIDAGLDTWPE